jgi:hypothetical protein
MTWRVWSFPAQFRTRDGLPSNRYLVPLRESVFAVQGMVQQGQGANARWHADPHHFVELLLLESGQAVLDPALYHIMKTMLAEQGV